MKYDISNQRHHLRLDVKELFTKKFETPAVQMGARCSPILMTSAMLDFLLLIFFYSKVGFT